MVGILGSEARGVNVTATQLYHCRGKAAVDDGEPTGQLCADKTCLDPEM